jgi:ABC-2 type transport system ATP-binding protein
MSSAETAIRVRDLSKVYRVPERGSGLRAAVASLVRRRTLAVSAVEGVSFDVGPGEIVGFLGPNGAGKTTTIKMLSGLLYPTSGEANVLGRTPWLREREYLRRISLVMGQRNQLNWDVPALDSFEVNRAIYRVPLHEYRRTLDELIVLLELGPILRKPVRNLSLGERMKCELAAALLHRPSVLFLDEPTIGLDLEMQGRIRAFLAEYNRRYDATILLTSHYMADVEALCRRVILIHRGRLFFDGELSDLAGRLAPHKTIVVELKGRGRDLGAYGELLEDVAGRVRLRVSKAEAPGVVARLLTELPVADLSVEDPPLEEVIERAYARKVA